MKRRTILKCVLTLTLLLFPTLSQAFDSATDCPSMVAVSSVSDITTALGNYSSYLKDGSYVICFNVDTQFQADGKIPISNYLEIVGRDKPLVIYGLSLKPGSSGGRSPVDYTGILASVTGSNITLRNLTLTKTNIAEDSTTPALSITGSAVQLIDSTITATQTGISISNTNAVDILGTTITGSGSAAMGVNISDSNDVVIGDPSTGSGRTGGTISGFTTGINSATSTVITVANMTFENVTTPITGTGTVAVDMSKVGKKLNDAGNVTRVAGKAPVGNTGDGIIACDGHVELYVINPNSVTTEINYNAECDISQTTDDTKLCIYKGTGAAPTTSDDCAKMDASECECFNTGTCVFNCTDLNLNAEQQALFTYTEASGNTNPFSTAKTMSELPTVINIPVVAMPTPGPGSLTDGDDGDDGGSNLVGVEAGGEDGGGSITSSIGLAKGCSLVPGDVALRQAQGERVGGRRIPAFAGMTDTLGMTDAFGMTVLAMTMLVVPVVARVSRKRGINKIIANLVRICL